jgi:diphthine-ammonia ligase
MDVVCLFSGGKDSTLATFLMQSNGYKVKLVTFIPENRHSYMLHAENLHLCKLQAKAMNLKHFSFKVSGIKEKEVDEMLEHLKKIRNEFDALCSGAFESEYQKQRIDYIADKLKVPSFCPLWKRSSLINAYKNMNIIITKVAAEGLTYDDLGKDFNDFLDSSRNFEINKFFEGGEGETTVLDSIFFKKKIVVKKAKKIWHGTWGEFVIEKAVLVEK